MYKFECGCQFHILNPQIKEYDGLPSLHIDFDKIRLDCPIAWKQICNGETKGIFQLETNLGKGWSKKLEPQDIEELSALISIIRPGVLKSILNDKNGKPKNLSQHFVDRKFRLEDVEVIHPALMPILMDTYGILIYQEEAIQIAQAIAGFTLEEADTLRKAIGKKQPEIMTQIEKQFLSGCEIKSIVNQQQAEEIFGWIRESQKYSFNKSHAVSYAYLAYWCAFIKAHFPLHFYTAWLQLAEDKIDSDIETADLIFDAKRNDIDVRRPSYKNINFQIEKGGCRFGLTNIKGIGESAGKKIINLVNQVESKLDKPIQKWSWLEFLINMYSINKTAFVNTIYVGMLDHLGISRKTLVYEYQIYSLLSDKEKDGIQKCYTKYNSLYDCMCHILENKIVQSTRIDVFLDLIKALKKPSYDLKDSIDFIILKESELLSTPLTYTKFDKVNTSIADSTCKEISDGKHSGTLVIEIIELREWIIKSGKSEGKKMAFLSGKDTTKEISISIFNDLYEKHKNILNVGNIIGVTIKSNDKGNTATKIFQI